MQDLIKAGGKLFFFVEGNVPVNEGTEDWVLTNEQRADLLAATNTFRAMLRACLFAFPGDEEQFGGCLAAGRGFVHISPEAGQFLAMSVFACTLMLTFGTYRLKRGCNPTSCRPFVKTTAN